MEFLWSPWRMAYIEAEKPGRCIFCVDLSERTLRENLILARTRNSLVMLNKYPYNNGHILVFPRRHTNQLGDLQPGEHQDLSECLRQSTAILKEALSPSGMNLGMNLGRCSGAGIEDHLHWHVVPRWEGDTNFMPVIGSVKVMPQHLIESYNHLRPRFLRMEESAGWDL